MWWRTLDDPSVLASPTYGLIDASFRAADGIETVLHSNILRRLGLVGQDTGRVGLPEEAAHLCIQGREPAPFVISVGQEKGIRLHFNQELATAGYRDACWGAFAVYAQFWRDALLERGVIDETGTFTQDKKGLPGLLGRFRPAREKPRPLGWWELMRQVNESVDRAADPVLHMGSVMRG
jgi:hypothetical protein